MEQRLTKLWYQDDAGPSLLQPLSWLYGGVVALRRSAYTRGWLATRHVGKPVIVVGNLTVGGTGKTPLVIWLARQLSEHGLKVGIVSRGYGSSQRKGLSLVGPQSNWREVGDEPVLISRRTGCTTVVGRDRVAAAKVLVDNHVDVVIADDGLQHLRLARDCEIVVIDGARGFGNRRLLPSGPLREPASRVSAADFVVVNGEMEHSSLERVGLPRARVAQMTLTPGAVQRVDGRDGARSLQDFRVSKVHGVAGIGHPLRFFRDLRARGLDVVEHPFPDHHPFTREDLSFGDDLPVLMTEKDAVKCIPFAEARWWYVPTDAVFSETQAHDLLGHILRKIDGGTPPLSSFTS